MFSRVGVERAGGYLSFFYSTLTQRVWTQRAGSRRGETKGRRDPKGWETKGRESKGSGSKGRAGGDLSFFFILLYLFCYRGVGKSDQTRPTRAPFPFGVGSNVKTSGKQSFESFESFELFESFSAGGGSCDKGPREVYQCSVEPGSSGRAMIYRVFFCSTLPGLL